MPDFRRMAASRAPEERSDLALLYDLAQSGAEGVSLVPNAPHGGWLTNWRRRREATALAKAVVPELVKALRERDQAAQQNTIVNETLAVLRMQEDARGVQEKPDASFEWLRRAAHHCEPAAAIIEARIRQVAAFAQIPEMRRGLPRTPGFRVKLTRPEEEMTDDDKRNIADLEQFILECGSCEPPDDEKPQNWQPGFESFLKQIIRDTLTLDFIAVRRWASASDPDRFPVVCFAAVDAARIRHVSRKRLGVRNGRMMTSPWQGERVNALDEIRTVKMSQTVGGIIAEEYTAEEMATGVRNPRTDETANGYGYSELERAFNAITIWIWSREYNAMRFHKDSLPRGVMTILGQLNEGQFQAFQLHWKQMMQGLSNRWSIPILRGLPGAGSSVIWTPFDQSSREMEYHQFMFAVALWMHAIFGIHPEETGYEALSPFRPPLSEASPESKLKYGQDTGLGPLLRWLQGFINREIVWKLFPNRRYSFVWVGTGDMDMLQHIQLYVEMLNIGLITPRMVWAELDQEIPEALANSPAWDMPMPFARAMETLSTLSQQAMSQQQMQQQMQMDQG